MITTFEPHSTTSDQNTTISITEPSELHPSSSAWMNLPSETMTGFFPEKNGSAETVENVPADDREIDWLDAPFTFDDGQQALFWVEWAHHLDGLGQ